MPGAFPCPACGSLVFHEPPGSYEMCGVCGWEDDGVQLANPTTGGGANHESLVAAQLRARGLRAPDFPRDPSWRPVSEQEIAWHRSECALQNTPWPNAATDRYYWRYPFERVYAVPDWYDGPILGIADHRGTPHRFRRSWDADIDDWSPVFELEPISERAFEIERELWTQWVRWLDAFDAGQTDVSTHPSLPEDRSAHDAMTEELSRISPTGRSFTAKATFRGDLRRCTDGRVRWEPPEDLEEARGRRR